MRKRIKHKKTVKSVVILLSITTLVCIFIYLSINGNLKKLLLIDAFSDNTKYALGEESVIGDDNLPNGDYFNKYQKMASRLDLSKLDSLQTIDIQDEYYKLSDSKESEIKSYILMCEILSRKEINPKESDIKLEPYHIYGSWFNETGMSHPGITKFNPYNDLIEIENEYGYIGPFQIHNSTFNDTGKPKPMATRIYLYIPIDENRDISDRVLRIHRTELNGKYEVDSNKIVGTEYKLDNSVEYIKSIRENIKTTFDRPNPKYLPDAMYTFARKLRTRYSDKDIYTLNNISDKSSIENIDKAIKQYAEDTNTTNKSDLYYLYALSENSSRVSIHQYTENGVITPNQNNKFKGMLPRIYLEMLKQYSTLDIRDLGLYNGWQEVNKSYDAVFGIKVTSTPMYNSKITYSSNLIDKLTKDSNIDYRSQIKEAMEYTYKNSGAEIERTMIYPLRALTVGKTIQRGIEQFIEQAYKEQLDKGIIQVQEQEQNDTSKIEGLLKKLAGSGITVFPYCFQGEDGYIVVTHGYYESNPIWTGKSFRRCCNYHPFGYAHSATDYTYHNKKGRVTTELINFYPGIVDTIEHYKGKPRKQPFGNSVIVKHTIDDIVFYSRYPHLDSISSDINVGDFIEQGTIIGMEGSTGNSSGNHLHFEIWTLNKKGKKVFYNFNTIYNEVNKIKCVKHSSEEQ